jgi:hypothetical protein
LTWLRVVRRICPTPTSSSAVPELSSRRRVRRPDARTRAGPCHAAGRQWTRAGVAVRGGEHPSRRAAGGGSRTHVARPRGSTWDRAWLRAQRRLQAGGAAHLTAAPATDVSARHRGRCRPPTGAASYGREPTSGATVSAMNRGRPRPDRVQDPPNMRSGPCRSTPSKTLTCTNIVGLTGSEPATPLTPDRKTAAAGIPTSLIGATKGFALAPSPAPRGQPGGADTTTECRWSEVCLHQVPSDVFG